VNGLWDGGTVNIDRVSSGRWVIEDCRLATSLMAQPKVFESFLEQRGKEARDIGLLARNLIAFPPSTQGSRPLNQPLGLENLAKFNRRALELLQKAQKRQQSDEVRQRLKFDWLAQRRWDEIFNFVESSVGLLGHLAQFKDYAAKYADNLARIAATFHCFEGHSGDISLETLERAQAIASWYLESFKHMFSPPPLPINMQPTQDAESIRDWLANKFLETGITVTPKKRLAQYGPYRARPVHRLNPALALLECWQVICPQIIRPNPTVELHPFFVNRLLAHRSACATASSSS